MDKRNRRWMVVGLLFLTTLLIAQPVTTLANHDKQKKADKKKEKFVNGHDARDGRLDGRGPKVEGRVERGIDDRNDDRYDRNRSGRDERFETRRQGSDRGYREGYRAGTQDRAERRRFDPFHYDAYRNGTGGFHGHQNLRDSYRDGFRDGFRRGYENGFRGTRR